MENDEALRSAVERLPLAVIIVDSHGFLQPMNRKGTTLVQKEGLAADLLQTRPSHPLSALIRRVQSSAPDDSPERELVMFPSGNCFFIEPSRRSQKSTRRWLMLLIDAAHEYRRLAEAAGTLTPREQEIGLLMMQGLSHEEIREKLNITANTLKTHVRHIFDKTETRTRTDFVVKFLGSSARGRDIR